MYNYACIHLSCSCICCTDSYLDIVYFPSASDKGTERAICHCYSRFFMHFFLFSTVSSLEL